MKVSWQAWNKRTAGMARGGIACRWYLFLLGSTCLTFNFEFSNRVIYTLWVPVQSKSINPKDGLSVQNVYQHTSQYKQEGLIFRHSSSSGETFFFFCKQWLKSPPSTKRCRAFFFTSLEFEIGEKKNKKSRKNVLADVKDFIGRNLITVIITRLSTKQQRKCVDKWLVIDSHSAGSRVLELSLLRPVSHHSV